MQRKLERLRRRIAGAHRLFAAVLAFVILAGSLYGMVFHMNIVTVTASGEESKTLLTNSTDTKEIVQLAGIETAPADKVIYTEKNDAAANVVIHRAFPVNITADGITLKTDIVEGTVADALKSSGINLGEEDIVEPAIDSKVYEDMEIKVARVTYKEESLSRQEIEDEHVEQHVSTLPAEQQEAFKYSNRNMYNVTYKHRLIDGKIQDSDIIELTGLILPREPGSTAFDKGVPCSRIEGYDDIEVDENGVPTNAKKVMENAVCTAYSASRGKGSSGLGLYNGTVAVNPNVIPYGTRLYITSKDNSFVYGYAIATDTGGAMMEGRVDIDLFFETNGECLRFGKRALDVYILD